MKTATRAIAHEIRDRWLAGHPADALEALEAHPELSDDPSAVVNLAYEEFCLREAEGESVDPQAFCGDFPGCRSALRQMLSVHVKLGAAPRLLDSELPPLNENWPKPGTVLFDCIVIRQIGVGAFSRVYLGRETTAGGRPVVLKVSRVPTGEASRLGVLNHPHIVEIHWSRFDPVPEWYVTCMPFVGAATLTHVIDHVYPVPESLPPEGSSEILAAIDDAVRSCDPSPIRVVAGASLEGASFVAAVTRLGHRLAETLGHLHKNGYAHGDLKPANILMARGGRPLLLDFNLARGGATKHDRVGGTFPYMPPEHLQAFLDQKILPVEEASAADVFSLGVILYELLTGKLPFGEPTESEPLDPARGQFDRQLLGYTPLRERNPRVPPRLADLIHRCLDRDPAVRPTADRVAAELTPRPKRVSPWLAVMGVLLLFPGSALLGAMLTPTAKPTLASPGEVNVREGKQESEGQLRQRGLRALEAARQLHEKSKIPEAQQRLTEADAALGGAIEAKKKQGARRGEAGDYFARGQVQLLLGDVAQAETYFLQAHRNHREANGGQLHGPTLAYLAYCSGRLKKHIDAIAQGQQALEAGYRTPAVLSNLAFSMYHKQQDLPQAKRYLTEAIRRDPKFAPAYHNRAMIAVAENPLPGHALTDIDRASELSNRTPGGEPADLCLLGFNVYVCAADHLPKAHQGPERILYLRKATNYLERAAELGANLRRLAEQPHVETTIGEAKIEAIAAKQRKVKPPTISISLIEPRAN